MTINLALLGAGRIGMVHANTLAYQNRAKLVAVNDAVEKSARNIADNFGCEMLSVEQIANSSNIDGVLICTPTTTHAQLIEMFARAGKAIFCEKPIDLDLDRARATAKVIEETEQNSCWDSIAALTRILVR